MPDVLKYDKVKYEAPEVQPLDYSVKKFNEVHKVDDIQILIFNKVKQTLYFMKKSKQKFLVTHDRISIPKFDKWLFLKFHSGCLK